MFNSSSSPTVNNCTFLQNGANAGGGMYNIDSSPTVTNCQFTGNNAPLNGGGMYNLFSSPTVTNCMFDGNISQNGGGMCNLFQSNPTVTNCTFSENAAYGGGGMDNYQSSPTVTNTTFRTNSATGRGGGMDNSESSSTVSNCTFSGNTAPLGGGMFNFITPVTVTNCVFSGNTANKGGGMYNNTIGGTTVTGCVFSENSAVDDGGGMFNQSGRPTVTDSILWDNSPETILDSDSFSTPIVRFSDIQGGIPSGATDGGGNIDAEPMFVRNPDAGLDGVGGTEDDDYGDLRLLAGSPSINTGDPAFIPNAIPTDLDGHARVLCMRVDMGAYEFGVGDIDCDQTVTLTDFTDWAGCMTGPDAQSISPACEAFDFEFDSNVDLIDWAGFQNAFTGP